MKETHSHQSNFSNFSLGGSLSRGPDLSWPDHSRSEAAVKGDHREPRERACPLTAGRAKGTELPSGTSKDYPVLLGGWAGCGPPSPPNARLRIFFAVSPGCATH